MPRQLRKSRPLLNSPLCWLLLFAFLLRATTIFWGVPLDEFTAFYHADEVKSWGSAVDFPANYLSSENYLYGTAVQYIVGILLTPLRLAMDSPDPAQHQRFIVAAVICFRLFNVLLGTAAVCLTFVLGQRLFDRMTGLIAAALLAVSTSHVMNSPLCTLDVPMSFLLVASFLLTDRAFASGRPLHFAQAAVVAGLLCGTKLTGFFFLAVPFAMLGIEWWESRSDQSTGREPISWLFRNLVVIFLPVAGLVFAVSTPHVVLSFGEYLEFMQRQKLQWYDRSAPTIAETGAAWFHGASDTIGPIGTLYVVVLICVADWTKERRRLLWPTVLFVVGYFLFWRNYLPARFVAFVAPLLCVLAAPGVIAISRQMGQGDKSFERRTFGFIIFLLLGPPVWQTGAETLARWNDPRTESARFIHDEIPAGTSIGMATDSTEYTWRHHQWRYPRIDWTRYRETPFLDRPEVLVVSSIELDLMRDALQSEKLLDGFVWDERFRSDWYQLTPPSPEVFRFYDDLLHGRSYELIRRFSVPANPETGGLYPAVFVYRSIAAAAATSSP
ncbi:phospholipid carrier-dependent glycosyltransferase [bacterium]|nr:phospholipid carrier-dependent glycosyltransferase [bacterium]